MNYRSTTTDWSLCMVAKTAFALKKENTVKAVPIATVTDSKITQKFRGVCL